MSVIISPTDESSTWVFVIHTDQPTATFHLELTAYCTGKIGDEALATEYQGYFEDECPPEYLMMFNNLLTVITDDGVEEPSQVWATPGQTWKMPTGPSPAYQSVAILFLTKPTQEQCDIIRDRAKLFCMRGDVNEDLDLAAPPSILGFEILERHVTLWSAERFDVDGTRYLLPSEA